MTDPNALRQALLRVQMGVEQVSSLAPAEITPDVDLLGSVYADAMGRWKGSTSSSRRSAGNLSKLSAPEMQAAATRLQAYSANVCKVPG